MLNVLVSYAYMKGSMRRLVECSQDSCRWMLDSGAFSAFTREKAIELDDYAAFCRDHGRLFWQYVALDKVGDPAITKVNLARMTDAGLAPMPVFVLGAPIVEAVELRKVNRHLCVAGGVSLPDAQYGPRLAGVYAALGGDCWLHGLGYTRGLRVKQSRVHSVDSSTWREGTRWGLLPWFDPLFGIRRKLISVLRGKPFVGLPPAVQSFLVSSGVTFSDLTAVSLYRGVAPLIDVLAATSWLQYAAAIHVVGVRFFFAVASVHTFWALAVAARRAVPGGVDWKAALEDVRGMSGAESVLQDDEWVAGYLRAGAANLGRVFGPPEW